MQRLSPGFSFASHLSLYNTMLTLNVQIGDTVTDARCPVMASLEDAEGLHDAIDTAVEKPVYRHIGDTKQSPNTG